MAAPAMGTRFELVIAGVEPGRSDAEVRAAGEAALDLVAEWHERLTIFDPWSELSRINALACDGPVELATDLYEVLAACQRLCALTEGAFDPACGGAMRGLGFRATRAAPTSSDARDGTGTHPDRPAAPCPAWDGVELDHAARTIRFTRPGVELDAGGFAKGLALDQAGTLLRELGVTSALMHGGTSSVLAIGAGPGQDAWRVALGPDPGAPVAVLRDSALSVSSPDGRTIPDARGGRIGHVVDARTGLAIPLGSTVACVSRSALEAEAWSTAGLVLGAHGIERDRCDMVLALGSCRAGRRRWRIWPEDGRMEDRAGPGSGIVRTGRAGAQARAQQRSDTGSAGA